MECGRCGQDAASSANFCPNCGQPLIITADERRVVTVLFADIVGYTAFSEQRDPEQVKNFVDTIFSKMTEDVQFYGGSVDKLIGDAMVVLFGAPIAHEDDAERAVRAALQMQQTIHDFAEEVSVPMTMRIGINTGEVLVGALRAGGEYTAMGDVVNTAQRLQAAAEPTTIVVGSHTYRSTKNVIRYQSLGVTRVKGKVSLVHYWKAIEPMVAVGSRSLRKQTPFYGRKNECGALRQAIASSVEQSRAQMVVLAGEAGVGKSRIVEEVIGDLEIVYDAAIFEGRCVAYGETNIWWAFAEIIRQICRVDLDDGLNSAESKVVQTVYQTFLTETMDLATQETVGTITNREDLRKIDLSYERVATGLLQLLGFDVLSQSKDPQYVRKEIIHCLGGFFTAVAQIQPLMLVLTDLHWADDVILEGIGKLAESLAKSRCIFVVTTRPEVFDRWKGQSRKYNYLGITVEPFNDADARQFLAMLLREQEFEQTHEDLLRRSGGNPFFIEELAELVIETRKTTVHPSAVSTEIFEEISIDLLQLPDTLRGLLLARLDGLDREERLLVEAASVYGSNGVITFLVAAAKDFYGITKRQVVAEKIVDDLVRKGIFYVERGRWIFSHDLVRDVAYTTLTKSDRARIHIFIIKFLTSRWSEEPDMPTRIVDMLARHHVAVLEIQKELIDLEQVDEDFQEKALYWATQAIRRNATSGSATTTIKCYDVALNLIKQEVSGRRIEFLLGKALAQTDIRWLDEAMKSHREAEKVAIQLGDPFWLGRYYLSIGSFEQKTGDYAKARPLFDKALEKFIEVNESIYLTETLRFIARNHIFVGSFFDAEVVLGEALARSTADGDRAGQAWALQLFAWISFLEDWIEEAAQRLEAAHALFTELSDEHGLGWTNGLLAFTRMRQGRFEEAKRIGDEVWEETTRREDLWGQAMMLLLRSQIHYWLGEMTQSIDVGQDALRMFDEMGDSFGLAQVIETLGRANVASGRIKEGFGLLQDAFLDAQERNKNELHQQILATGIASVGVQIGDPEVTLQVLQTINIMDEPCHTARQVERRASLALAHLQRGEVDIAYNLLDPVIVASSVLAQLDRLPDATQEAPEGKRDEKLLEPSTIAESTELLSAQDMASPLNRIPTIIGFDETSDLISRSAGGEFQTSEAGSEEDSESMSSVLWTQEWFANRRENASVVVSPGMLSVYAVAVAMRGEISRVQELAQIILQLPTVNYFDRLLMSGLLVITEPGRTPADVAALFEELYQLMDEENDLLSEAIALIGHQYIVEYMDIPKSEHIAQKADEVLAKIGQDLSGWKTIFRILYSVIFGNK